MVDRHELMEQKSCRVLAVRLAEKVQMRFDPATFLTPAQGYTDVKAIVFKLYKKLDTEEEHTHCSLDPLPRCARKIYH
ncbi:hypothetical protein KIN20_025600 [Parelaphostrongylus tenuis]|uniref:Uncharacterized protein n=1 Tax=Parelaphostrongylus tenuis TaxID=148309 RepID=A0AAD5N905_PARTN|nr:hypothetical protein KIN20_025600 [Parelaphostrongylus tenuis]